MVGATYHQIGNPIKIVSYSSILSRFLAILGLYLLCYTAGSPIALSDVFLLVSAIFFALHILVVGYYSHRVSSLKLSCLQFFVMFLFSLPLMLTVDHPLLCDIIKAANPILFSGIVVTAIAYTLQVFGQKHTSPVITALIMSLESVFAVIGGIWLLGESLTVKESFGCLIMIIAIILAQLDFSRRWFRRARRRILVTLARIF